MFRRLLSLIALLAAPATSQAACPANAADVRDAANEASAAFAELDEVRFARARDDTRAALTCLTEPLPAVDAAAVHRVEALDAFLRDDPARATAAFRAARALQPGWALPATLAPPGSPLDARYRAAVDPVPGTEIPVHAANGGALIVDGDLGASLPAGRPVVVQGLRPDGRVDRTDYLWPGEPLPSSVIPGPAPDGRIGLPAAAEPDPRARALSWGAVGAAALATGLYGLAWNARDTWSDRADACADGACDPVGDRDTLATLRTRTHVLVGASAGAGALALGLGVAAVTVRW